ncbi:hypothetical protein [Aquimarina spinulae]|uniref:hypothetical protein n=2 Tax=Aquimarina spinulae TaxID=1192023 RepID=UPI000D554A99|nr:hypothetical protein [Aquimarina spinulae]
MVIFLRTKYKIGLLLFLLIHSISLEAQIDYNKFKGEKINGYLMTKQSDTYIYDYKINARDKDSIVSTVLSGNSPEAMVTKYNQSIFSDIKGNKKKNYIALISRLKFSYSGNKYCLIKYQTVIDSVISNNKIATLLKKKNSWTVFEDDELFKTKKEVLRRLSINVFWKFYIREDDPDYPEINKLKPKVKDNNEILNLTKLAKVIQQNEESLRKYLEQ